jgi:hypothetical protein
LKASSSASSAPTESRASSSLDELLADTRVWRGRQTRAPHLQTLSTGWPALDAVLPGSGWPLGALTELLPEREGLGELELLFPAMARLTDARHENAWVAWVAPPHVPYAPALAHAGVRLERMLVINIDRSARRHEEVLWAMEQTLRSGLCAAVVGWFEHVGDRGLRRLQLAAEEGRAWGIAFRQASMSSHASPAALRLAIRSPSPASSVSAAPTGDEILIDVIKSRGGRPSSGVLCTRRSA